ncbi:MAG TPA: ABC transporter permease, partial [Acidimicrobiales bacterium]|nr:ABC transporter permease [Acidimicrobiales bacterium]
MTTQASGGPADELHEVSRRPSPVRRMANVWAYRELLGNLARKELKVKYKDSVLGFVWSLLNPILYLVVFSLVFREILRVQVPDFGIFLLSGLLAWNLFSAGVSAGTASIVGNAGLVQKVWFPREILPLANLAAALVHFFL